MILQTRTVSVARKLRLTVRAENPIIRAVLVCYLELRRVVYCLVN